METNSTINKADKDAVKILRDAYMKSECSDILFNARQYLQDRERYERMKAMLAERATR